MRRRYGRAKPAGLADAVRGMRVFLGSVDFVSVRDQQRLYARVSKLVGRVASSTGIEDVDAWRQIEAEARRQGIIRPMPGQHL